MIDQAFDEDLVDTDVVDRDDVQDAFESGGRSYHLRESWLAEYREWYSAEMDQRERFRKLALEPRESPTRYESSAASRTQALPQPENPIVPIRKAAPQIGRNDPCWCGSGKKYKKCHLGKDAPQE
jgi:hypothetical protein